MSDRMLAPFVSAGGLADVDQVFGADQIEATFDATALRMADVGGKHYGVPWVTGTIGVVANGKVMEAAGITGSPATMDEWLATSRH